tara:strand:- start:49 stop:996 length:948 start_codon:yes stop_codon:yes gene_type:complete
LDYIDKKQYPISQKLNISLLLLIILGWGGFQYIASQTQAFWMIFFYGVCFSVLMMTCYSLLHESAHDLLFQNNTANYMGGAILALTFIFPITAFKKMHHGHHLRNRTDLEMFDLYYPSDNKLFKVLCWYAILLGLWWIMIAVLTIIAIILPSICIIIFRNKPLWINSYAFLDISKSDLVKIQLEAFSVIIFQIGMFFLLDLNLIPYLILYGIHAISWSSQNYIYHAFAPRDTLNGAHNLGMNPVLKPIYLNINHHLVHHHHPEIPWVHLPKFVESGQTSNYGKAYLQLWKGPRLTTEPAPKSLDPEYEKYLSSLV